ncbi:autophagy-like protein 12 [Capronia coronata CBS 617.96]|uniref:Ubiquitin-like protein ATG12 n=1 Tax=Capronia coronata CBS 617.96 TaxID=1182541 RepID=W9YQI3_9EURO|nr:autophagy-like protein 12 [Capronia coronata CBS 617.96]EXJ95182.1 autophagy-like protein 12 [Capronia coronata CBS 617.96]
MKRSPLVPQHKTNADNIATPDDEDEDDQEGVGGGDLPMSMTASVILTHLPKDASQALKEVDEIDNHKVSVRFQAIGSAPILKQRVFKINASSRFSVVLNFLRKKLGIKEGDGLFLYVNSVFAPGLDEGVGNLFRCFKTDDQLIVSYSATPAFG